ncbi:helix-turn-helix domain-containing protein [Paeniglutamicibacter sp. MACA_103]|uniref:helix-turn-helix domain-containing protein n=1 Tax=Paeniglutamicibacter sp. MACA_103 TaxID=3377337 RepID=UPI003895BE10
MTERLNKGRASLDAFGLVDYMSALFGEVKVDTGQEFAARVRSEHHQDVRLMRIAAPAHSGASDGVVQTSAIAPALICSYQVSGRLNLVQHRDHSSINPGDIVIYRTDAPVELRFDGRYELVAVTVPLGSPMMRPLHSRLDSVWRLPADDPVASALGLSIDAVERGLSRSPQTLRTRMIEHSVGAVEILVAHAAGTVATPQSRDSNLLQQALRVIDERLRDPSLGVDLIAAALFVSSRRLYREFHASGMTVASSIRQRRLERCRSDLTDPLHASRSLTEISSSWGLTSPSHFSLMFHGAFGCPPSEYRAKNGNA